MIEMMQAGGDQRLYEGWVTGGQPKLRPWLPQFNVAHLLHNPEEGRRILEFAEHDVIFAQGDPADALFHVLEGELKLTVTSSDGREAVLANVGKGELFGEGCLTPAEGRTCSAIATAASVLMRLDGETVFETAMREPMFLEGIISHVLHRTAHLEADYEKAAKLSK